MPGREEKEAELAAVLCGFLLIVCILVLLVVSVRHLLAASDADLTKRNKVSMASSCSCMICK